MKFKTWVFISSFFAAGIWVFIPHESMDASQLTDDRAACDPGCNDQNSASESLYNAFEKAGTDMPVAATQRWHREYEKNRNYGESWFFLVHTRQGGVLFATISITNLGLRTFDSACDVRFYAPGGEVFKLNRYYQRKDISTTTAGGGLDLTIGSNRLRVTENFYHLGIEEAHFELDMTLKRSLPAFQFGNGRVSLYEDRSAEWNISIDIPRSFASGILTAGGKMFSLAGDGYHDHTWSTVKLPTLMQRWYTLRLYKERFSIILHQIHLTQKFGGGMLCAGLIGDGDNLIPFRRFLFKPLAWREETTSGLNLPTDLQLCINAGEYTITGTLQEAKFLDAIDVLGQLSWPIRTLIKSFYTKPYLIRYLARYDLDVVDINGVRYNLSGRGVVSSNSF